MIKPLLLQALIQLIVIARDSYLFTHNYAGISFILYTTSVMGAVSCVLLDLVVVKSFVVSGKFTLFMSSLTLFLFAYLFVESFSGSLFVILLICMSIMNVYVLAYSMSARDLIFKRFTVFMQSLIVSTSILFGDFARSWVTANIVAICAPFFLSRISIGSNIVDNQSDRVKHPDLKPFKFFPKAILVWSFLLFMAFQSTRVAAQGDILLLRVVSYIFSFALIVYPLALQCLSISLFNILAVTTQILVSILILTLCSWASIDVFASIKYFIVPQVFLLLYPWSLRLCLR